MMLCKTSRIVWRWAISAVVGIVALPAFGETIIDLSDAPPVCPAVPAVSGIGVIFLAAVMLVLLAGTGVGLRLRRESKTG